MLADEPPAAAAKEPMVLVLMGVSGSGKSTVAGILAGMLGWPFVEGDTLHSPANIAKMAAGHALTDEDRRGWLEKVAGVAEGWLDAGSNGIITSSALKRAYRELINRRGGGIEFVYLAGDQERIADRLASRRGHFMPQELLATQFADLEEPASGEPAIRVDISGSPAEIAAEILDRLGLSGLANHRLEADG